MNALMDQETEIEAVAEQAQPRPAAARATPRHSRRFWDVALVSGAVCFGVVTLLMTPTIYTKLVQAHQPRQPVAENALAAAAKPTPVDPVAALRGKGLFAQGCNACHGDDARGRPGLGKDLAHSAFVKSQAAPQLVAFLKRGRDINDPLNTTRVPMPPKGGNPALNDKQLGDIVSYVRSIQQ